jgi:hypothetical protein
MTTQQRLFFLQQVDAMHDPGEGLPFPVQLLSCPADGLRKRISIGKEKRIHTVIAHRNAQRLGHQIKHQHIGMQKGRSEIASARSCNSD